jgi:quinol monooxygenase YgiN
MTYVIVARWRPREGEMENILTIQRELAAAIRKEPGNVSFTAHRAKDDPNELLLYEVYKSEEAFEEHRRTPHFKALVLERAVPLLASREVRAYSVVDDI